MLEFRNHPKIKAYILDAIICNTFDEATKSETEITDTLTPKGKLQFFAQKMKEEFCYEFNIQKHNGVMPKIIADYIKGSPSSLAFAESQFEIEQALKELDINSAEFEVGDDLIGNWYRTIGRNMHELFKENGIDVLRDRIGEPEKIQEFSSTPTLESILKNLHALEAAKQMIDAGLKLYITPTAENYFSFSDGKKIGYIQFEKTGLMSASLCWKNTNESKEIGTGTPVRTDVASTNQGYYKKVAEDCFSFNPFRVTQGKETYYADFAQFIEKSWANSSSFVFSSAGVSQALNFEGREKQEKLFFFSALKSLTEQDGKSGRIVGSGANNPFAREYWIPATQKNIDTLKSIELLNNQTVQKADNKEHPDFGKTFCVFSSYSPEAIDKKIAELEPSATISSFLNENQDKKSTQTSTLK